MGCYSRRFGYFRRHAPEGGVRRRPAHRRLTRRHLNTPTPYNTYTIRGLPPGPIASPGTASIEAALYPAHTDYLFFVSKKDNTHQFSVTIEEHNRAVRKYQLRRHRKAKS